jgi:hypothetical protein
MRPASLRILTAFAAARGFYKRRWDFVAAYLQGTLEAGERPEVNYCAPAHPATRNSTRRASPSSTASTSPSTWHGAGGTPMSQRSLFPFLLSLGFTQFCADSCFFRKDELIDGVFSKPFSLASTSTT